MGLRASVAPFIFGGVCLYGIDSVMCPLPRRQETWKRQATDLDRQKLATLTREIDFSGVPEAAAAILAGQVRGRVVIKIR